MAITDVSPPSHTDPPPADDSDPRPPWRRPPILPILGIWAALTVLLIIFAVTVPARLMGTAASADMKEIESTVTWFTVFSAPVAAMVWSVLLYSLIKWRHRGSEAPPETAPPIRSNAKVMAVWVIGSSVLCLILLVWGLVVLQPPSERSTSTTAPLVVEVTGQQWAWNFTYPDGRQTNELYLPVDQKVLFKVTSEDVVHSFWLIEMGIKVDANPGETTVAEVTPTLLGTFTIRCAELCGLYHSYMQTAAHVLSKDDYAAWAQSTTGATS
ncbi:MAG: cytochrome c oxidase subunit II [Cellulomonas sp.]